MVRRNGSAQLRRKSSKRKKGQRWLRVAVVSFGLCQILLVALTLSSFFHINISIPSLLQPSDIRREEIQQAGQTYAIPNVLIFTHSVNLLSNTSNIENEDIVLRQNVFNTIGLHPNATVRFLTDDGCVDSIKAVLGDDTTLVNYFRQESHGMFKADICRGAALYETGGLYFDVDLQARIPMWNALDMDTEFVVPRVHFESKYPGNYFNAFIGVSPRNPIILRYLQLFLRYYEGKMPLEGPLGVLLLRQAHLEIMEEGRHQIKHQVWQEVQYHKKLFPDVEPPTWGTRRACKFVVVANILPPPFIVPFYSRVKGSRMCGGADTNKKL